MSVSKPANCPKCGVKWIPGRTICEVCGWDIVRQVPDNVVYWVMASVVPFMCCGYCTIGYPLVLFASPRLGSIWTWAAATILLAYGLYRFLRPKGGV